MRTAWGVIALAAAAGCRCKDATQPVQKTTGPKDAAVVVPVEASISEGESTRVLRCLFDRARSSRDVLSVLGENLAPPLQIRRAVDVAAARAKEDGETPVARVLFDAVDAYTESGDRDGLIATFQAIDALSEIDPMLFGHHGPQRTRVGLRVDAKDFGGDELEITRERALAGDKAGAARFYDEVAAKSASTRGDAERIGALVAIDRIAEAKAVIAAAKEEDRLKLAGVWLDVALRRPGPIDEAMQVVLAELATAPDRALIWFGDRATFRRAARLGRGRDLAPLYKALKARYARDVKTASSRLSTDYELASIVGDAEDLRALEKEPLLADELAAKTLPIEAALAKAKAQKYPLANYTRVWLRAVTQPVPPGFGATLVTTICPPEKPPAKPGAPPLAGARLTVKEKSRGMRQECHLHDVIVTLADAGGTKLGSETLEGECTGACTAAEKREGQRSLDEIQKRIDDGEASQSQTDYNFTDCMFRGPDVGTSMTVAGRQLALIPVTGIGPHDVPNTGYLIAIEVCGALHVLDSFGTMYAHHWKPEELTFRESADKSQIIVDGASNFYRGVVVRITLPATCPGAPALEALETE